MKRKKINIDILAAMLLTGTLSTACVDKFLPETLEAFDKDAAFSTTMYRPVLGRNNIISNNFNSGNSTLPLTFSLLKVTAADGSAAPELTDPFPVRVWKSPYMGTEKSLAEIEAKRTYENRPLFQVVKNSGEIVLYANALSSFVKCSPNSGYLFDVRAENSGGYKDFVGMQLIPEREMDYEPNTSDPETGFITDDYVHPVSVSNMYLENSSGYFGVLTEEDIQVYFRRNYDMTNEEKTLTFRFLKQDFTPIDPKKFAQTDWDGLVHGFDREITDTYVRYKVAYPIPLSDMPTAYTTAAGDKAHVSFKYDRIRYNSRVTASLDLDFAIYTEGHWEIVFVFAGGNPEFRDNV